MSMFQDTVAAIATPPGKGGIGVVRISGDRCSKICRSLTGVLPEPNQAKYVAFKTKDKHLIDKGIVLYFKSPHSYTGEDVLECQIHGSDIVLQLLLDEIVALGARLAKPGEFTERAFLNDKLDLVQAEAVSDLIDSKSKKAARSAMQSLTGVFSNQIDQLQQQVFNAKALLEASLDFPEEGDVEINVAPVILDIEQALETVIKLLHNAEAGSILSNNSSIVLAGKPNVGKSSLLNYLSRQEAAIVSETPGTTRDLVKQNVLIDGYEVTLVDTAGIRDTVNEVEQEGVERSLKALKTADLILYITDSDEDQFFLDQYTPENSNIIYIRNKIDLCEDRPTPKGEQLAVSAKTGEGMIDFLETIKYRLKGTDTDENLILARKRHIDALQSAKSFLEQSLSLINNNQGQELVSESLRQVLVCFDDITGKTTSDDILGAIFSQFCIGK